MERANEKRGNEDSEMMMVFWHVREVRVKLRVTSALISVALTRESLAAYIPLTNRPQTLSTGLTKHIDTGDERYEACKRGRDAVSSESRRLFRVLVILNP